MCHIIITNHSTRDPVRPFFHPSSRPSPSVYPSVVQSTHSSVCLSTSLTVLPFIHPPANQPTHHVACLFINPSGPLSIVILSCIHAVCMGQLENRCHFLNDTGHWSQTDGHRPLATNLLPQVTDHWSPTDCYRLPTTN